MVGVWYGVSVHCELTTINAIGVDILFMRDANAKGESGSWLNNPRHVTRPSWA